MISKLKAQKKWLANWFEQRSLKEQRLLLSLFGLVVVALLWAMGIAPALRTLRESGATHATLDAQLAQMQIMAQEAERIKALPQITSAQAKNWLEGSIKNLGKANMSAQGNQIQINFTGVTPQALATWLTQARTQAQLIPIQASWKRNQPASNAAPTSPNAPPPPNTPSNTPSNEPTWDGSLVLNHAGS